MAEDEGATVSSSGTVDALVASTELTQSNAPGMFVE